jgi:hypothetical protein
MQVTLVPGRTQAFVATGTYSDNSTKDITAQLTYQSTNPDVATIDAKGVATALTSGDTNIIATDPVSGIAARNKPKLTVAELKSLTLAPASKFVRPGDTLQLSALGTYDDGTTNVDLTNVVSWTSSSKGTIATVSDSPGTKGLVTGLSPGSITVTATEPESRVRSASSDGQVTVVGALVSISVSPAKRALRVGETTRYHAIGSFAGNVTIDITGDVNWSLSVPAVATIDVTGKATGVSLGDTAVTAVDRTTGISSHASAADGVLSVVGAMTSLTISPATLVLATGASSALKATATFAGRSDSFSVGGRVNWSSSNPTVAKVNASGTVSCVTVGTAVISAKDPLSGFTSTSSGGNCALTCAGEVVGIRVAPASNILLPGRTKQMKAFRIFGSGNEVDATKEMVWSSSEPKVVSIVAQGSKAGLATALQPGKSTIIADDPVSGLSSDDRGGTDGVLGVPGVAQSVTIFPRPPLGANLAGKVGTPLQMKARVQYQGGLTQGVNALVTWSSSNPAIAVVSNGDDGNPAGFTRFMKAGTVTISIVYPKIEPSPTPAPTGTPGTSATPGTSPTPVPTPTATPVTLTDSVVFTVTR